MKDVISAELVKKAQEGDKNSLGDLIARSDDLIRSTISNFRLASEANDLLQDIRIKVIENLPKLDDPKTYPKWLKVLG